MNTITEKNSVDIILEKYKYIGLKFGSVIEIRDIFGLAVTYNKIYQLKNIDNITIEKHQNWVKVLINNKEFEIMYVGYGFRYRCNDKNCSKKQVVDFLVNGLDNEMESYANYRGLYKAIRDKDKNAMTLFKDAVDRFDWYYENSDDNRVYRSGVWAENTLKKLSGLLGKVAIDYFEKQQDKY